MRELVLATVLAEIKNTFKDDIDDPNLVELLYGGITEPLGLPRVAVSKGTASLIMNRQPKGKPHKIIRNNSQDDKVKASIDTYFEKNVIKHFLPGMEDEVIFHLRGVIKDDRNISDAKRAELQLLGKKETFAEFLGQVYLYSLTRDNVLSPEAKQMLERELEDYKKNPLQTIDIPESIINEERAYTAALMAAYAQELGDSSLTIDTLAEHAVQAKHLAEQRKYYFAAEAVRRGTRDIYQKEDQFDVLKEEIHEGVKEVWEEQYSGGIARLRNVLKQAGATQPNRCWLYRDTDWLGIPQKKGVCHFLVNDGSIEGWVRDDDEKSV